MSEAVELQKIVQEMRDHFLVPPEPGDAFSDLDRLIEKTDAQYQAIAQNFRHNLGSALSSVALPFALASASVHGSVFQKLHIAESIRALQIELEDIQSDEPIEDIRKRAAYQKANIRMKEFVGSEEGTRKITIEICEFLLKSLDDENVALAAREVIGHGVVLIWSAFEILFRDVFELELNLHPSKIQLLLGDVSTRKRLSVEKLSLDTLVKHKFDLSDKIGTIVVAQQDFSDLPTIKTVYSVLIPTCMDLRNSLNNTNLWLLYQRRHLFVHRRGIVDQPFLNNTNDVAALGSTLRLKPADFEEHLESVARAGEALLPCLTIDAAT